MGCNNFPSLSLEAYVKKQKLMASNVCVKGLLIQNKQDLFSAEGLMRVSISKWKVHPSSQL